jgi:CubicO group peptidase (beta-lactamase class C family)
MSTHSKRPQLSDDSVVEGFAEPEFDAVREEFKRNFTERGELGAACAIYHRGRKVVDLWGGQRCRQNSQPWRQGTLCLVFSVTKGMAATAMAVAHSRGLFELDLPVAHYWPEFQQAGKGRITVRQLLAHQSGLVAIDRPVRVQDLLNHDAMAEVLASQCPAWVPGMKHGYHTLTLGWYQSELIRRVDPKGRSLGQFFRDEVAAPLQAEFYIGLPSDIDETRLADIAGFHRLALLWHFNELPLRMVLSAMWRRSLVRRSVQSLRLKNPAEIGKLPWRGLEIPSANGIGQARGIAQIYGSLATGGRELGITNTTWQELIAPALLPHLGSLDAVLKMDTQYSFGFSRPSRDMRFGSSTAAFGCPGAGGSMGLADPEEGLGFAYVTNKMGFRIFDDVREKAIRDTCYQCLRALRNNPITTK